LAFQVIEHKQNLYYTINNNQSNKPINTFYRSKLLSILLQIYSPCHSHPHKDLDSRIGSMTRKWK